MMIKIISAQIWLLEIKQVLSRTIIGAPIQRIMVGPNHMILTCKNLITIIAFIPFEEFTEESEFIVDDASTVADDIIVVSHDLKTELSSDYEDTNKSNHSSISSLKMVKKYHAFLMNV